MNDILLHWKWSGGSVSWEQISLQLGRRPACLYQSLLLLPQLWFIRLVVLPSFLTSLNIPTVEREVLKYEICRGTPGFILCKITVFHWKDPFSEKCDRWILSSVEIFSVLHTSIKWNISNLLIFSVSEKTVGDGPGKSFHLFVCCSIQDISVPTFLLKVFLKASCQQATAVGEKHLPWLLSPMFITRIASRVCKAIYLQVLRP